MEADDITMEDPITHNNSKLNDIVTERKERYELLLSMLANIGDGGIWTLCVLSNAVVYYSLRSRDYKDNHKFDEVASKISLLDDLRTFKDGAPLFLDAEKGLERIRRVPNALQYIPGTAPQWKKYRAARYPIVSKSYKKIMSHGILLLIMQCEYDVARMIHGTKELWARLLKQGALDMNIYEKLNCINLNSIEIASKVIQLGEEGPVDNKEYMHNSVTLTLQRLLLSTTGVCCMKALLKDITLSCINEFELDPFPVPMIPSNPDELIALFDGKGIVIPEMREELRAWYRHLRDAGANLLRYNLYAPSLEYFPSGEMKPKFHSILMIDLEELPKINFVRDRVVKLEEMESMNKLESYRDDVKENQKLVKEQQKLVGELLDILNDK